MTKQAAEILMKSEKSSSLLEFVVVGVRFEAQYFGAVLRQATAGY